MRGRGGCDAELAAEVRQQLVVADEHFGRLGDVGVAGRGRDVVLVMD